MRNPLTMQVESYVGAIFIALLSAFFVGLMFITMKNFDSDLALMDSQQLKIEINRNFGE